MNNSPYRQPVNIEIVVRGEPRATFSIWAVWCTLVFWVVILVFVEGATLLALLSMALAMTCALVVFLVRRTARRVRWRVVLDGFELSVRRVEGRLSEGVTIDVRDGLLIDVGIDQRPGRLDPQLVLITPRRRVALPLGPHPTAVVEPLVEFLQKNGVSVKSAPDARVGWSDGPGYGRSYGSG